MRLRITLEKDFGFLEIGPGNQTIDSEKFLYYHDLDDKLISAIDKLLTRNSIDLADIVNFNIVSSMGPESSSHKIAEAFISGIKISV